jgi:tRNA-splicing ligase RtcB
MSRTQAAGKSKRRKVWECSHRDCDYRAPLDRKLPGGPAIPCPHHPEARLARRWLTEQVRAGVIDWSAVLVDLDSKQIELRGGAADEAPGAYKRLEEVLDAHADTIQIKHRLTPIGVAMAGADVFDPFKD